MAEDGEICAAVTDSVSLATSSASNSPKVETSILEATFDGEDLGLSFAFDLDARMVIRSVAEDGAGAEQGVLPHDHIIRINGHKIPNGSSSDSIMQRLTSAGRPLTLEFERGLNSRGLIVPLSPESPEAISAAALAASQKEWAVRDGKAVDECIRGPLQIFLRERRGQIWREKYFVLDGTPPAMHFYDNEAAYERHKGAARKKDRLVLSAGCTVSTPEDPFEERFLIHVSIAGGAKVWKLGAPDDEERTRWLLPLRGVADGALAAADAQRLRSNTEVQAKAEAEAM